MSDLTPRQSQVLQLIRQSLSETGMPPTRAEIAAGLGLFRSASSAEDHLQALARKGCARTGAGSVPRRAPEGHPRRPDQQGTLPLVGRVAAGLPLLAVEKSIAALPRQDRPALFPPRADYLLQGAWA